jgi:SM-20-related protein
MADAVALARLGIFVQHEFLDDVSCASLRKIIGTAQANKAVVVKDKAYHVDEKQRRTTLANVSDDVALALLEKLAAALPSIEAHYGTRLSGCSSPEFLLYREGDYFRPHSDRSEDSRLPREVRSRKISAVIFLNNQSERPSAGAYGGGYLTFFNLLEEPTWQACRFKLSGESGLLVAFPSETVHEVTPVTHGERFTIVSWFYHGREARMEDGDGAARKHSFAEER